MTKRLHPLFVAGSGLALSALLGLGCASSSPDPRPFTGAKCAEIPAPAEGPRAAKDSSRFTGSKSAGLPDYEAKAPGECPPVGDRPWTGSKVAGVADGEATQD